MDTGLIQEFEEIEEIRQGSCQHHGHQMSGHSLLGCIELLYRMMWGFSDC